MSAAAAAVRARLVTLLAGAAAAIDASTGRIRSRWARPDTNPSGTPRSGAVPAAPAGVIGITTASSVTTTPASREPPVVTNAERSYHPAP